MNADHLIGHTASSRPAAPQPGATIRLAPRGPSTPSICPSSPATVRHLSRNSNVPGRPAPVVRRRLRAIIVL